ncbi:MAG TPA: sulfite oxidase-like oxidoreductase [Dehalococcoidia bacterium]|nr:sulfite oxidase-like oxidoreductase [Dehalococcoidia bacterium]
MDPSRLPPGQHLVRDLPVLHLGSVPRFDPRTWDLRVEGEVEEPLRFSWAEFLALPRVVRKSDVHCVTGWTRLDNDWEGVLFQTLADLARPRPEARFVTIEAEAGYFTSLPLDDLLREDVLLAYRLDGKDLAPEHGWPLRLVVPHKYIYKSAKWVRAIRFTREQEPGFWEQRGYSNSADPWKEERYA